MKKLLPHLLILLLVVGCLHAQFAKQAREYSKFLDGDYDIQKDSLFLELCNEKQMLVPFEQLSIHVKSKENQLTD